MKKILTLVLSLAMLFSWLCISIPVEEAEAADMTLVWSDEFDGTSLNTDYWTYEIGNGSSGWGNNELEYYTNRTENLSVANGIMTITARNESYNGYNYTSARIKTQDKVNVTYGKIEARMALPVGQGVWPAFWMLGQNIGTYGWPACGEIDIMEHVNNESNTHGTIHWQDSAYASYGGPSHTIDVTQYHVYSVEWTQSAIKWFIDDVQFWEANIENSVNGTDEFHKPHFLLFNLAIGGNWPGSPDSSTQFPAVMNVDYVRVYQDSTGTTTVNGQVVTGEDTENPFTGDNIALNKSVTSSGDQNDADGSFPASNAVDGISSTRWSSTHADNQYITVDLGNTYTLDGVRLLWEAAYATNYRVEVSEDGSSWTTAYTETAGNGGTDNITLSGQTARYIRIYCVTRATEYGFSLYEVQAYGSLYSGSSGESGGDSGDSGDSGETEGETGGNTDVETGVGEYTTTFPNGATVEEITSHANYFGEFSTQPFTLNGTWYNTYPAGALVYYNGAYYENYVDGSSAWGDGWEPDVHSNWHQILIIDDSTTADVFVFKLNDTNVLYANQNMKFAIESPAQLVDGKTLVPLRAIGSAVGIEDLTYTEATSKITFTGYDGYTVEMTIGSTECTLTKDGSSMTVSITAPVIMNGVTMLPLRDATNLVGGTVKFDDLGTTDTGYVVVSGGTFEDADVAGYIEAYEAV